jgi:hypothetical protein
VGSMRRIKRLRLGALVRVTRWLDGTSNLTKVSSMNRISLSLVLALTTLPLVAQNEGMLPTQTLVRAESKSNIVPTAQSVTLELNSRKAPLTSFVPVTPGNMQVALLIDDGLSRSAGVQLQDLKAFASSLPAGVELLVGYMANGSVQAVTPFTTDHAAGAARIRMPFGSAGMSGSPYLCLSDFVKHWPGGGPDDGNSRFGKARFVMMITNGVDPYNGSTAMENQNSPYVEVAVADAQRAGVQVSSIYYRDAGFQGGGASMSGQGYLQEMAQGTGGEAFYQGSGNPVSLAPFLQRFTHSIAETYVATFNADASAGVHNHLVRVKMTSNIPKLKLRHPESVRPGTRELSQP